MGLADDILRTHQHRVGVYSDVHSGMAKVRQTYYGELNIPLPEIDGMTKPPIPNLLQTGVDQLGGRIVSTVPIVQVLARTPSRTERRRAQTARYSRQPTKETSPGRPSAPRPPGGTC